MKVKATDNSPWGESDSPAIVTEVETALERELSLHIMRDGVKPEIRKVTEGEKLVSQGRPGDEMFLLLDGVLTVEVDVGPGVVLGERAVLERGWRTSTLRARTPAKVAVAHANDMRAEALAELASHHRREAP